MDNYIYFITHAEPKKNISFGHFFRCLEIAKFLRKKGFNCFFVLENPNYVREILKKNKFKSLNLNKSFFNKFKIDKSIIIFDKFKYIKRQFKYFELAKKIIIFDDFNKYNNSKKYLRITTNLGYLKYSNNHVNSANFRLSKFLNMKLNSKKIKKNNFLIFLGGSDIKGNFKKIINLMDRENINKKYKFNFYLGKGIKNKYKNHNNFYFHKNDEKTLKNLINTHNNIITNGGNTMLEMVVEKKKCLVFPSNYQEILNAKFLLKKKIIQIYDNKIPFKANILKSVNLNTKNIKNKNLRLNVKYIKSDFKKLFRLN